MCPVWSTFAGECLACCKDSKATQTSAAVLTLYDTNSGEAVKLHLLPLLTSPFSVKRLVDYSMPCGSNDLFVN